MDWRISRYVAALLSVVLMLVTAAVAAFLTGDMLRRSVDAPSGGFVWTAFVVILALSIAIGMRLARKADEWLRRRESDDRIGSEDTLSVDCATATAMCAVLMFGGAAAIRAGRPIWDWPGGWGGFPWWALSEPHARLLVGQAGVAGLVFGMAYFFLRLVGPGAWAPRARVRRLLVEAWDRRRPLVVLGIVMTVVIGCHVTVDQGLWRLPHRALWVQGLLPETIGVLFGAFLGMAWLERAAARVRRAEGRRLGAEVSFSGIIISVTALDALLAEFVPKQRAPIIRSGFALRPDARTLDEVNVRFLLNLESDLSVLRRLTEELTNVLILGTGQGFPPMDGRRYPPPLPGAENAPLDKLADRIAGCALRHTATDEACAAFVSSKSVGLLVDRALNPDLAHAALRALDGAQNFATVQRMVCGIRNEDGQEFASRASLRAAAVAALGPAATPSTLRNDERDSLARYRHLLDAAYDFGELLYDLVFVIGLSERRYLESRAARAYWRGPVPSSIPKPQRRACPPMPPDAPQAPPLNVSQEASPTSTPYPAGSYRQGYAGSRLAPAEASLPSTNASTGSRATTAGAQHARWVAYEGGGWLDGVYRLADRSPNSAV